MWIAFIFQYLWDTKQLETLNGVVTWSCELLSFFSIFGIQNNHVCGVAYKKKVVNCFHFSVSLGYKTTYWRFVKTTTLLWIAFIFQYLWDTKQLISLWREGLKCCELLSFFSIFGIQNNYKYQSTINTLVVNCFHFSVSLGYKTTIVVNIHHISWLWIAFIFQYLWDTKQPGKTRTEKFTCCELLSFFSIFGIQNNFLK